jgi:hypothetical protein
MACTDEKSIIYVVFPGKEKVELYTTYKTLKYIELEGTVSVVDNDGKAS